MDTQKKNSWYLIKRLWQEYLVMYRYYYAFAIVFMVVSAGAAALLAYMVEPLLDKALGGGEAFLWLMAFAYLGVCVTRGLANYLQTILLQYVGTCTIEKLQKEMFKSLQYVDMVFFADEGTAKQLSRFSNDVNLLNQAVTKVLTGAGRDIITIIFMVFLLFYQNWKMALVAIIVFPLATVPVVEIGKRMRKISNEIQSQLASMIAALDDSFKGAGLVRAYGLEIWQIKRANALFHKARNLAYKSVLIRSISSPLMESITGISFFVILLLGGFAILEGEMTKGQFMSFFVTIIASYQPMKSLSNLNTYLQEGLAAIFRVFTIIDTKPKIMDTNKAEDRVIKGDIKLKNVHFSYEESSVLRNVNCHFEKGKITALVGRSGSGKTTIFKVLLQLFKQEKGEYLIDDIDQEHFSLSSLRSQMALVSQESGIFDITIRENIAFGFMDATKDDIMRAAKKARAHDFIMSLPHQYETKAGELGRNLSGGQRQRIALARAFLRQASILLLDEATASLDSKSEHAIMETLFEEIASQENKQTIIIIAHRLSTILKADTIFVMKDGCISEQGTHESLLKLDGDYADLYKNQLQ